MSDSEIETNEDHLESLDFDSRVNAIFNSLTGREKIVQALCEKKPVKISEKVQRALGIKNH